MTGVLTLADAATPSEKITSTLVPLTSSNISTIENQEQHYLNLHHHHILTTSRESSSAAEGVGASVRSRKAPAWRDVERRTSVNGCDSCNRNKPAGEAFL